MSSYKLPGMGHDGVIDALCSIPLPVEMAEFWMRVHCVPEPEQCVADDQSRAHLDACVENRVIPYSIACLVKSVPGEHRLYDANTTDLLAPSLCHPYHSQRIRDINHSRTEIILSGGKFFKLHVPKMGGHDYEKFITSELPYLTHAGYWICEARVGLSDHAIDREEGSDSHVILTSNGHDLELTNTSGVILPAVTWFEQLVARIDWTPD